MRFKSLVLLLTLSVLCCGIGVAEAALEVDDYFKLTGRQTVNSVQGHQGPFRASYSDLSTFPSGDTTNFITYCTEVLSSISFGTTYQVLDLAQQNTLTPRKLTGYTAWVYSKYDELTPTELGKVTTQKQLDAIQAAIWAGMIEKDPGSAALSEIGGVDSEYYDAFISYPTQTGVTSADFETLFSAELDFLDITIADYVTFNGSASLAVPSGLDVSVVQLKTQGGSTAVQDQIYLGPGNPITVVPEPSSLAIATGLMSMLIGCSWCRRRREV